MSTSLVVSTARRGRIIEKPWKLTHKNAGVLPDKTRLESQRFASKLFVIAVGNLFSIAEVGEQLAWLGAAIRSAPDPDEATYCTARLSDPADYASDSSDLTLETHVKKRLFCKIEFQFERIEASDLSGSGNCCAACSETR